MTKVNVKLAVATVSRYKPYIPATQIPLRDNLVVFFLIRVRRIRNWSLQYVTIIYPSTVKETLSRMLG